ncbi:MAG: EamA family transporter [Lachnospiraceae bacterium]|nr:EamA family transporter [Lachnospiraceae bacterium]MBQ9233686.1 EamA family transporter [Lachnospiraceae bacterium]
MKLKLIYIAIFLVSVFVSSVSQIILKKSAGKTYESKIKEYMNLPVIFAYGLFFMSSLLTVLAYKYVPLSMGPILESTGYIWVSILGYIILKEGINKKKVIGLLIIIAGIIVFNL